MLASRLPSLSHLHPLLIQSAKRRGGIVLSCAITCTCLILNVETDFAAPVSRGLGSSDGIPHPPAEFPAQQNLLDGPATNKQFPVIKEQSLKSVRHILFARGLVKEHRGRISIPILSVPRPHQLSSDELRKCRSRYLGQHWWQLCSDQEQ